MEYIFLFFFLNFGFYSVFLIINIISLTLYSSNKFSKISTIPVSVIVAIRNGEKSLNNLIKDLLSQDYKGQVELIFVDDQSNDNTEAIIKKAQNSHPSIKYVSSDEESANLKFKKRALSAGIKKSKFDVLLFTDVDCQITKSWISSMAQCFEYDVDYVIGFSRSKSKFGIDSLNLLSISNML